MSIGPFSMEPHQPLSPQLTHHSTPPDPMESLIADMRDHVPDKDVDDTFLLWCLKARSGSVDQAATVATRFLRFRRQEGWPIRLSAEHAGRSLLTDMHWLLPGTDLEGRGLFCWNARCLSDKTITIEEHQRAGMYLAELALHRTEIVKNGITIIADMRGTSISTLADVGLRDIRRTAQMWCDAFPLRLKCFLVVGVTGVTRTFINIVLSLLPKKLCSRVQFVTDVTELYAHVDPNNLPESLGGNMQK